MGDNKMNSIKSDKKTTNVCDSKALTQLLKEPPKHLFSNIGSSTFNKVSQRVKDKANASKQLDSAMH